MTAEVRAGEAAAKNHVLLVDDDEPFREAMASLLRGAGYHVWLAPNHRLALEILESDKPVDVSVVDIVMPDSVNGLALARMARLRRPHIGIVYLTGYDIPGFETAALGPIVRKPVDDDRLLDAVARVLSAR
jgi:CheY-like chemotaxis protein